MAGRPLRPWRDRGGHGTGSWLAIEGGDPLPWSFTSMAIETHNPQPQWRVSTWRLHGYHGEKSMSFSFNGY